MGGVFINYRGEDSHTAAALIDRELTARFGGDSVFLDCRSIPAGSDFVEELLGRLRTCSVLLVVIGPTWVTLTDAAGERRIDDPRDWIRREIAEAFACGLRVVPVLLDGVEIPAEADLPADLARLSRRQYVPLRRRYTTIDLAYLVQRITEADPELAKAAAHHQPSAGPVPRQLPAAPGSFVGRCHELAQLTAALDAAGTGATVVISALGGTGGIGKTWLALHWAHHHLDRFPDGQLFVNLRGFDPTGEPMAPAVAVRGFLDALGVEPQSVPVDLDAQAALYRSLVAGKRMLIVVDNARDTAQVESLLPGSPSCTVIVTSRLQLGGLVTAHGARPLALDVLNEAESRELLARRLGADRIAAEPEAVAELLAGCAGLPLALSIVAARAALHPALPLAVLAGELREASTRLGALDAGDIRASLAAVFSWSYQALDPQVAGVFRLLGLAPGPDISLPAAASLTGLPTTQTGAVLRALERVSLLQQHTPGRYRMHDLVKLYAADQARHQSNDSRDTALRRLVDFYLHTAYAGERLLEPHRPPIEINPSVAGCHLHPVPDQAAAWTWLETEHPCLLATQHLAADQGWHSTVWQLAWTLNTFHYRRGHLQDQLVAWQAGLAAAQRGGDAASLLRARQTLGHVCARVGRHADALDHLSHALDLAQNTGDLLHQATTHQALAGTWELEGDDQQALQHATSALHLCQDLDDPMREADVLNAVGWFSARLGYYQQALIHCKAALTLHRHHHYREGEAATLDSLGYLAHRTGQHDQALDYYHQALTLFRDLGNTYREADILDHLGQTHAALGHHDQARHAWRQALELYQDQYRTAEADRIQQQLDDLTEPEREQREVFDKEG